MCFGGMTSTPWIWWISSFKGCNLEEIGCRQPWNFLLWKIAPAPLAIIFLVDFIWKIRHKLLQSGRGQLPPALKGFSWKSSSCMITLHSPSSCWTHRLLIKRDLIQRPRQFRAMAPGALCSQADPLSCLSYHLHLLAQTLSTLPLRPLRPFQTRSATWRIWTRCSAWRPRTLTSTAELYSLSPLRASSSCTGSSTSTWVTMLSRTSST